MSDLSDKELEQILDPKYVVLYSQQVRLYDEIKRYRLLNKLPYCPPLPKKLESRKRTK